MGNKQSQTTNKEDDAMVLEKKTQAFYCEEEYSVFSWLQWAPELGTPCHSALHEHFPAALPGPALHQRLKSILGSAEYGFKPENTLLGTSVCPDEINNKCGDLIDCMKHHWGHVFPLGGISGAPFVGATGFKAFSHHVPDNGDIIIVYGPHVAISETGEIGQHLREGQPHETTACGAVIAAYNACCGGPETDIKFDDHDMQIAWIKKQLKPHAKKIKASESPMSSLAYQAFEMVNSGLEQIINTDFGSGRLVLMGGIQINMPAPFYCHFLPLKFEIRQKGKLPVDIYDTIFTTLSGTNKAQEANPQEGGGANATAEIPVASPVPTKELAKIKELWAKKYPQTATIDDKVAKALDVSWQVGKPPTHNLYQEISLSYQVFGWLQWAPEPGTPCHTALHAQFPGAVPGPAMHHRIKSILGGEEFGENCFNPNTTLLGTSICPDEINNECGDLIDCMKHYWGHVFPLGGIGGPPFVGATGFKAFSHHVPDNGDVIIVYGPHTGISSLGDIGWTLREGQRQCTPSCGALISTYHALCNGQNKATEENESVEDHACQMGWIKNKLAPSVKKIQEAGNPMADLAYKAYEMVNDSLEKIVDTDFGSGRLVLIGGIQINMPEPFYGHFLPLKFEVRQKGQQIRDMYKNIFTPLAEKTVVQDLYKEASLQYKVFSWLHWSPGLTAPCLRALHTEFPGAVPGPALHYRLRSILSDSKYGFKPETTLIGTSICPDEINNECGDLIDCMKHHWGHVFPLGGIGGAPFVGNSGFKAFSHHVPENGDIIIVYGPHVGISSTGELGKCFREGQGDASTSCGAVVFAYNQCLCSTNRTDINFDENDMQIAFIKRELAPHARRISESKNPLALLSYQAYDMVHKKLEKIVNTDFGSGRLVLIGGIQINMPLPFNGQFLPLRFEVRQKGSQNLDLLSDIALKSEEETKMGAYLRGRDSTFS